MHQRSFHRRHQKQVSSSDVRVESVAHEDKGSDPSLATGTATGTASGGGGRVELKRGRGRDTGGGRTANVSHSRSKTLLTTSRGGRKTTRKMTTTTRSRGSNKTSEKTSEKTSAEKTSAEETSVTTVGRGRTNSTGSAAGKEVTSSKMKDGVTEKTRQEDKYSAQEEQRCDPVERGGGGGLQSPTVSTLTSSPRPVTRDLPQKRGVAGHQEDSQMKDDQLEPVSPSLHSRFKLWHYQSCS